MKKILGGLVIAIFLTAASSYWWTIRGPWLDQAASFLASKESHLKVQARHVNIARWSDVHFDSLVIASPRGEQWLNIGRGEIWFEPSSFLIKPPHVFQVRLERIIVLNDFYKEGLAISLIPPKWLEASSVIDEIYLRVADTKSLRSIQILRYRSAKVGLRGAVQFAGKKIFKMHLVVSASDEALRRLPGVLRSRLFQTFDGRQGARIVYCKNTVTALGHGGPFFKFQWQPNT